MTEQVVFKLIVSNSVFKLAKKFIRTSESEDRKKGLGHV